MTLKRNSIQRTRKSHVTQHEGVRTHRYIYIHISARSFSIISKKVQISIQLAKFDKVVITSSHLDELWSHSATEAVAACAIGSLCFPVLAITELIHSSECVVAHNYSSPSRSDPFCCCIASFRGKISYFQAQTHAYHTLHTCTQHTQHASNLQLHSEHATIQHAALIY